MFGQANVQAEQCAITEQQELAQFNEFWRRKLREYEQESENIFREVQDKQKVEMEQFIEQLRKYVEVRTKDSLELQGLFRMKKDCLNLEKYAFRLADRSYRDCHKLNREIKALIAKQAEKDQREKKLKIDKFIVQMKLKKEEDNDILKQRILQSQNEQLRIRESECAKYTSSSSALQNPAEVRHHRGPDHFLPAQGAGELPRTKEE